jgi:hypothetical protein
MITEDANEAHYDGCDDGDDDDDDGDDVVGCRLSVAAAELPAPENMDACQNSPCHEMAPIDSRSSTFYRNKFLRLVVRRRSLYALRMRNEEWVPTEIDNKRE